jgi:hypothetical protein
MSTCLYCHEKSHDFKVDPANGCPPPREVCIFGIYNIDIRYKLALYFSFPDYDAEYIIASYLGHNERNFMSQREYLDIVGSVSTSSESGLFFVDVK